MTPADDKWAGRYTLFLEQTDGGRFTIRRRNVIPFCGEPYYGDPFVVASGLGTVERAELRAASFTRENPGHIQMEQVKGAREGAEA